MPGNIIPARSCALCPRRCGANRAAGPGLCGGGAQMRVARVAAHYWEEPCISGTGGSGAVFFCGCGLGCVFCQNREISSPAGKIMPGRVFTPEALAEAFISLQNQNVHNLNLVTAAHYRPWVQAALALARSRGLTLPVVWNTGGYESEDAIKALSGDVDIWLFDLKFCSPTVSLALAGARDYFAVASGAAKCACALAGPPIFSPGGLLRSGVILRLLVLPGHTQDAKRLLDFMAGALPEGGFLLSLMRQYTPPRGVNLPRPLHRPLASYEYKAVLEHALSLGLARGYTQGRSSATGEFLPRFDG